MDILQMKNNINPKVFLVIYRILGILFGVVAFVTLLASLMKQLSVGTLIPITYIIMDVILVYGFWNLRRWVVTLIGMMVVFSAISGPVRVFMHTQKISTAVAAFLTLGIILLFSYLSRERLNGEYNNFRVIRVFLAALMLSQLLNIFLK